MEGGAPRGSLAGKVVPGFGRLWRMGSAAAEELRGDVAESLVWTPLF